MRRAAVALCLALAASCVPSSTKTEITNVVGQNAVGAVGVLIYDYYAAAPLGGVTATLFTGKGPITGTGDATTGFYSFANVPVGNFTVVASVAGYGSAVLVGTLDSADPARPVTDPQTTLNPIGLVKMDGTFAVRIVDEQGAPVNGAVATMTVPLQYIEYPAANALANGTGATPRGSFVVSATSGADGTASFTGLPEWTKIANLFGGNNAHVTVSISPILVASSTINYSFNGGDFAFNLLDLDKESGNDDMPTITLNAPDSALKIEKSSIEYLEGSKGGPTKPNAIGATVSGPITIQFNNVINEDPKTISMFIQEVVDVQATQANNKDTLATSTVAFAAAVNGNILTLTPTNNPATGKSYWFNLQVQAKQKAGGAARVFSVLFPFWGPLNDTVGLRATTPTELKRDVCTPNDTNDTEQIDTVTVLLNEPIGVGAGKQLGGDGGRMNCVVYFPGANFDAHASLVTGEVNGNSIVCDLTDPLVTGTKDSADRSAAYAIAQPTPTGGSPTGFTAKWTFTLSRPSYYDCEPQSGSDTVCNNLQTAFTRPNGMVNFTFRFQDPNNAIHRVNGAPVTDFTISNPLSAPDITIPSPISNCTGP